MDVLRVFVGGLPRHIEPEELTSRFIKFGKVLDVEVKNKLDATGKSWNDELKGGSQCLSSS